MTRRLPAMLLGGLGIMGLSGTAAAATYNFEGMITTCTDTCLGFASLDVGSIVVGSWTINTTANGSWGFADISDFGAIVQNPSVPLDPGPSPTTINPLPLIPAIAPVREGPAGPLGLVTGGTTDADNQLNSGTILHEFIVPPLDDNAAWAIFNIGPGGQATVEVCVLFTGLGCIPGGTQAVVIEGQFTLAPIPLPAAAWLLGPALLGLAGLRRRRAASDA